MLKESSLSRKKVLKEAMAAIAALTCSGCSFIFVTPPPELVERPHPAPNADCSTSRAAPIVDGLIAGYQVFRTAYAAQASESDYRGSPISREADLLLGLAFTGLFIGSTIYGGVNTSRCKRLKTGPGPDEELTGVSEESWSSSPPAPAALPEAALGPREAPVLQDEPTGDSADFESQPGSAASAPAVSSALPAPGAPPAEPGNP